MTMPLPARISLVALLLISPCVIQTTVSQTSTTRKDATASVSGKVTINGKPARGILVGMRMANAERTSPTYRGTTNEDGIFRINNIASGGFQVAPVAPGMMIADVDNPEGQHIVLAAGDNVEGVNFDLIRGGVVTGKITDADGRPLVEERVVLAPAEKGLRAVWDRSDDTDDRGIYRLFGIRPGRYKVAIGEALRPDRHRLQPLPPTYYPDVTDPAKATVIEVVEGSETANIDIKVGPQLQTYSVSGRVVDSESGEPLPNASISLQRVVVMANGSSTSYSADGAESDHQGNFRITNLRPATYQAYLDGGEGSDLLPQAPVTFEVTDADVTDLVLKTSRGAQISGVVIFDGGRKAPLVEALVYMSVRDPANGGSGVVRLSPVAPNGSFESSSGMPPGVVSFTVGTAGRYLNLRRVERDGIAQPNSVSIQKGEHISGIRLFVNYSSGGIRGSVRIINGTLPENARVTINATRADAGDPQFGGGGTQADARGNFLLEGLVPGNYEVTVSAYLPDSRLMSSGNKQTVTVTEGAVTDVVLTFDARPLIRF